MGNVLLQQALSSKYLTLRGNEAMQVGSAEMQGYRLEMEVRFDVVDKSINNNT